MNSFPSGHREKSKSEVFLRARLASADQVLDVILDYLSDVVSFTLSDARREKESISYCMCSAAMLEATEVDRHSSDEQTRRRLAFRTAIDTNFFDFIM